MSELTDLLTAAVSQSHDVLGAAVDEDWGVHAGDVTWSCRATAAHVVDDLFSYASQVIARPTDRYLPVEAHVDASASTHDLLESIVMSGELLRLAVSAAPADSRAWHPYGTSDPDGFAAMGAVEVLVHTHDIACGLAVAWTPPADLSAPVLARLFPDAPGGDPGEVLLWSTGRRALESRPRLTEWRWDSSVRGPAPRERPSGLAH